MEEVCGRKSYVVKCKRNPPAEPSRQVVVRGLSEVLHDLVASVAGSQLQTMRAIKASRSMPRDT